MTGSIREPVSADGGEPVSECSATIRCLGVLAVAVVSVCVRCSGGPVRAGRADDVDADLQGWTGPVSVAEDVMHAGRKPLRWALAEGDTIVLRRPIPAAADAGGLSLWVHSERLTAARIDINLLAPDTENSFQARFSVEWTGWNHIQLERDLFRAVGSPAWDRVQGLRLSGSEGPIPPTVLHVDEVSWTDASPRWQLEHGELLIAPLYHSTFSPLSRWQPDEETQALSPGAARLTRRWNSLVVERGRASDGASTATYRRAFNLDISDIRALRVQASYPSDATLALSATIDGSDTQILPPTAGADNWHEVVAPVGGRRLTALSLHCGDTDSAGPGSPRHVEYHFHFVTAETHDFDPPTYPSQPTSAPLPDSLQPRQPLLEGGIPVWLYFGLEDVPALREKVRSGVAAEMFAKLRTRADGYLEDDPTPFAAPYYPTRGHEWLRPWYASVRWADTAQTCAFMYVLTEDMRYAEQARRALLAMAGLEKWNYGMISRYPVGWGGHGGPFCEASAGAPAALAYNWVYNALSDPERRQIEDAILWKSWYWLNDYIDTRDYIRAMNQGPWFNYGALVQAMAIAHRHPWLERFYPKYEANFIESIGLNYLRDGANTEGAAYWGATTRFVARALPLLAHVSGRPLADYAPEPLQKSIDMPIYMRSMVTDGFYVLGVNDGCYSRWNPQDTGLFFAALLDQPTAQWAWQETAGKTGDFGDLVVSIIWHRDWGEADTPELSLAKQFRGAGWIALRSGWDVGDLFFCIQSGVWGKGHQHLDKNSFVLEAYGERLCPDKGVPAYGHPMGPFFQKTVSHNAITIDGADQRAGSPRVLRFEHAERFDVVDSDATANYPAARKVVRRVLFMRPRYFVIADEIRTRRPASVEFNLHTFSRIDVEGDTIAFTGSKADMLVRVVSPPVFRHTFSQTQRSPNESIIHDVQLAPARPVTELNYVTVLYPLRKGQERPEIRWRDHEWGSAITVRDGDREDVIEWRIGEGFSPR